MLDMDTLPSSPLNESTLTLDTRILFDYAEGLVKTLRLYANTPSVFDECDWKEFRQNLPYLMQRIAGTENYVLKNRMFKSIRSESASCISINNKNIPSLANSSIDMRLFHDGNAPWNSKEDADKYFIKLTKLRASIL